MSFSGDFVAVESIELSTGSGDVELRITSAVPALRFEIQTGSGDISVRLPGLERERRERRRFRALIGDGSIPVRIRTSSGDVRVRADS